jgi:flagellar motor switch protein FliN
VDLREVVQASRQVGPSVAAALDYELGGRQRMSAGDPQPTLAEVVSDDAARAIVMEFEGADGAEGSVALITTPAFAEHLERVSADELIVNVARIALLAAITTLSSEAGVELEPRADGVEEIPIADARAWLYRGTVVFPLLDGADVVACVAVPVVESKQSADSPVADEAEAREPTNDAPQILADVHMGVTAELGTAHMKMRDLLSLAPGGVIDLDRSVGAPVDLLVNGTAVARGEVVVIDEEFGVRITEILDGSKRARLT